MRKPGLCMKEQLVSIITPIYNGEKFVEQTIQSVFAQTYDNYEWIIVDDGSTDKSYEVIEKNAGHDKRVKLLKQKNGGSAAARNAGIRIANGQYIVLLDADDLWDPEFLESQLKFMNDHKALCVCSSYRMINEEGDTIKKPIKCKPVITYKDMLVKNEIGCLTGVYNCSEHGKVYLDESLKSLRDDYAYWLSIVSKTGTAYGNPEVLASYRVFSRSVTGNKKALIKKQYLFYRKYLKLGLFTSVRNVIVWGVAGLRKL